MKWCVLTVHDQIITVHDQIIFLKHNKSWLNVDDSFNIDLFYRDVRYLIKEGNEILANKIMVFYKELSSTIYNPPRISYKNRASFSYNNMTCF